MTIAALAARDVTNYLRGVAPDGVTPLRKQVSFPKERQAVALLTSTVAISYRLIGSKQPDLLHSDSMRTPIVHKLAAFLTTSSHERTIGEAIIEAGRAAMMMAEDPSLAVAPIGIAGMVRLFELAQQRAAKAEPIRPDTVPPRRVHWALPDRSYLLTELTHPWHVLDEARFLGHCMNTMTYEGGPLEPERLRYWGYVKNKQSRLFSIAGPCGPACSIHVGLSSRCLIEIQALPRMPFYDAVPREVFITCIQRLKKMMRDLQADASLASHLLADIGTAFAQLDDTLIPMEKPVRPDRARAQYARTVREIDHIQRMRSDTRTNQWRRDG